MGQLADRCVSLGLLPADLVDTINGFVENKSYVVAGVTDNSDTAYPDRSGEISSYWNDISKLIRGFGAVGGGILGTEKKVFLGGTRIALSVKGNYIEHTDVFKTTAEALKYNEGDNRLGNVPDRPFLQKSAKNLFEKTNVVEKIIKNGIFPEIIKRAGKSSGMKPLQILSKEAKKYFYGSLYNNWAELKANEENTQLRKGFNKPLVESELLLKSLTAEIRS